DSCRQDPVLSSIKLIIQPWDCGPGGYQVGGFPPGWAEWIDRFRDTVRAFWKGDEGQAAELAARLTASGDKFNRRGRKPWASVNFIAAHDGFTLNDLVSYDEKHNEANGEENRDGESHNRSWNCGVEGPTDAPDAPEVRALRHRQKRNLLATLLLSQGIPMLLGGDEIGRTQGGNNNAYCQDNEVSWYDWGAVDEDLLDFTAGLIRLRREHPVFRRRRWFYGRPLHGSEVRDIGWFRPDGEEMSEEDWRQGFARSLAVFLNGGAIPGTDRRGEPVTDASFYLLFHAGDELLAFRLPGGVWGSAWVEVFDTGKPRFEEGTEVRREGEEIQVAGRGMVLLRKVE
ncbi:MAG: isoamylase, partial [Acidobacteriota bacterium]|nr:isoamylase [Acidobacteriota bacterium]